MCAAGLRLASLRGILVEIFVLFLFLTFNDA
jgi:hypothetical protein